MKHYLYKLFFITTLFSTPLFAQEGIVKIQKSEALNRLLALKKEVNNSKNYIKIQIYSGPRSGAEHTLASFRSAFAGYRSEMKYETPNYKIWIGNFRTKIEADRALKVVKKEYPNAFPFTPKQN